MTTQKQVAQGGLTYSGLAVTALTILLNASGLVPPGMDAVAVAGGLVSLGVAAYGRWRRDRR